MVSYQDNNIQLSVSNLHLYNERQRKGEWEQVKAWINKKGGRECKSNRNIDLKNLFLFVIIGSVCSFIIYFFRPTRAK